MRHPEASPRVAQPSGNWPAAEGPDDGRREKRNPGGAGHQHLEAHCHLALARGRVSHRLRVDGVLRIATDRGSGSASIREAQDRQVNAL